LKQRETSTARVSTEIWGKNSGEDFHRDFQFPKAGRRSILSLEEEAELVVRVSQLASASCKRELVSVCQCQIYQPKVKEVGLANCWKQFYLQGHFLRGCVDFPEQEVRISG